MKVMITGSAGFIGSALCLRLLARGTTATTGIGGAGRAGRVVAAVTPATDTSRARGIVPERVRPAATAARADCCDTQ